MTSRAEAPIAQPGKIDLGRTIGDVEIHNLPLLSRNPYNFAFLQANVTGYENNEFGVPRINANGSQMRTNYQLDGNTNTEKDRAGLRLLPISEVLVREVKVVTNGFAPEFGQTTGMVYNAITPSGTNTLHGSASYRFKRNAMSSQPFFLAPTARKPDTEVERRHGRPRRSDREGQGALLRRLRVRRPQPDHRRPGHHGDAVRRRRRSASRCRRAVSSRRTRQVNFGFGKIDYQVGAEHAARRSATSCSRTSSLSNIGGGLTTTDRATDFTDRMDSAVQAQLVSTLGASQLNELRVQFARRHQFRHRRHRASPARRSPSPASPTSAGRASATRNSVGFDFNQGIWQVIDNFTWLRASTASRRASTRSSSATIASAASSFHYTFPTIDAYLAAKSGANPFGYTTLQQTFGNLDVDYNSAFYGLFVQDDWQVTPRVKLLYGLRYDVFDVPEVAHLRGEHATRHDFTIDKNNIAPRVGLVVVARRIGPHRAARLDGPDVRAAAPRLLRQRDPEQRRSAALQRVGVGFGDGRSGVPDQPRHGTGRLRAAAPEHHRGRPRTSKRSRRG